VAAKNITTATGSTKLEVMKLDVSSFASVHEFSAAFHATHDRLHVLMNNAGIMDRAYETTSDGIELVMQTNHYGPFLLTLLLLDLLEATPNPRVINLSSSAHGQGVRALSGGKVTEGTFLPSASTPTWDIYGLSKLGNLLFSNELQFRMTKKLGSESPCKFVSVAVHPGVVDTQLWDHVQTPFLKFVRAMKGFFMKTPEQGAATQVWAAMSSRFNDPANGGVYLANSAVTAPEIGANDPVNEGELWAISLRVCHVEQDPTNNGRTDPSLLDRGAEHH